MSWFGWGGGKDDNKGGTSAGGSGNSRSRNPGGTTKSSSTLPVPGLDFSIPSDLGGEIDIDSIQFNDAELNDPSLLAELKALSGGTGASDGEDDDDGEAALTALSGGSSAPSKRPKAAGAAVKPVDGPPVQPSTLASRPAPPPTAPSKPTPPAPIMDMDMDLDVDNLPGVVTDPEADVEVEFNEEDENDPELLAELRKVHPEAVGEHHADEEPRSGAALPVQRKPVPVSQAPSPLLDLEVVSFEDKMASTDPRELAQYINEEKNKAINLKRSGDIEAARNALMASKQLEARLQSLSTGSTPPSSPAPSTRPATTPTSTSTIDSRLPALKKRHAEYRQAALAAKKSNDLNRARDMLVIAKKCEQAIDAVESGLGWPGGFEIPGVPSTAAGRGTGAGKVGAAVKPVPRPIPATGAPKTQPLGTVPGSDVSFVPTLKLDSTTENSFSQRPENKPPADLPSFLITSLKNQIQACTAASAFAYRRGDKTTALHFHKLKKLYSADLASIEALKGSGNPMPPFRTETVSYKLERQNSELDPAELEIAIVRGSNLSSREVGKAADLDVVVGFDLGYPTENDATKPEGRGETGPGRGSDPVFDFTKRLAIIDRTSRGLLRHFEKRKLGIEIWHNKGWFRGRVLIGRATVPLVDLLTKCEIREVVEVTDPGNPRKTIGGSVEVGMRLRTPLRGSDVVEIVERWVSLDVSGGGQTVGVVVPELAAMGVEGAGKSGVEGREGGRTPSPLRDSGVGTTGGKPAGPTLPLAGGAGGAASNVAATSGSVSPAKVPAAALAQPASSSAPTVAAQAPASASTTSPSTIDPSEELDELISAFDSPDSIVSNSVVEHENQLCDARLVAARTPKEREELADRKQALAIKEQMMVLMVQTGKLTMAGYLAQLKTAIAESKKLALKFKNLQRLDYAKRALERAKLMEKEADEVDEMIRSEAEGEGGGEG